MSGGDQPAGSAKPRRSRTPSALCLRPVHCRFPGGSAADAQAAERVALATADRGVHFVKAIVDSLGSVDKMKEDFIQAGVTQFGSGWAWLAVKDGKLQVMKTPNGITESRK